MVRDYILRRGLLFGRGNNGVVDIHLFGKAFFGRKNKSSNYLIRIYAGFTKKLEEPNSWFWLTFDDEDVIY
jgi:hypothetical protein